MEFLKRIFRRQEPAQSKIEIRGAGRLLWDDQEQYWIGSYNGVRLSVAYDGFSEPPEDFSDFIARSLSRPGLVEEIVMAAKEEAITRYPKELHHEIDRFVAKEIVFQGLNFILVQFFGAHDHEPFWFCELHGDKIYVGRDT
ncbi:hypothetical protein [Nitrincola sp. MINF-07-Sa-05]|uniref:hypothetical protein n=1 Tax=Nitrincola salilacus TaxID=3400273 RepID=UPI003918178A